MNVSKNLRNLFRKTRFVLPAMSQVRGGSSQLGDLGSGAGKGGGGGGAIREAGGSFGKNEAANEEEYFHKLKNEQLKKIKDDKGESAGAKTGASKT